MLVFALAPIDLATAFLVAAFFDLATDFLRLRTVRDTPAVSRASATGGTPQDCSRVHCPVCDPRQRAVIAPGACCPSSCERLPAADAGSASDAGSAAGFDAGTCVLVPLPGCNSNAWPYCAPDWQTAMGWYMGCPNPFSEASLARCDGVDASCLSIPNPGVMPTCVNGTCSMP